MAERKRAKKPRPKKAPPVRWHETSASPEQIMASAELFLAEYGPILIDDILAQPVARRRPDGTGLDIGLVAVDPSQQARLERRLADASRPARTPPRD